jgi:hypothetical protein
MTTVNYYNFSNRIPGAPLGVRNSGSNRVRQTVYPSTTAAGSFTKWKSRSPDPRVAEFGRQRGRAKRANLVRGMLYPLDTPDLTPYDFFFNPEEIEGSKTPDIPKHSVPGYSLPAYQWMSGGEKTIKFKLQINRRYCHHSEQDMRVHDVNLLERYTYTDTNYLYMRNIAAPRLMLVLGMWAVPVGIKNITWRYTLFRPDMVPYQGEINLDLFVWSDTNIQRGSLTAEITLMSLVDLGAKTSDMLVHKNT